MRVLEIVAQQEQPLGVSEIGRRTGLSKSTVHALLGSLVAEGLLEPRTQDTGFRLGHRLIHLSRGARDSAVVEGARGVLRDLSRQSGEMAFVGRLAGESVVILQRAEIPRSLSLSAPLGAHVPVLAGALGKAYLGMLGPETARAYLDGARLPRFTDRSVITPERYLSDARLAASRGYALDSGEYLPGVGAATACFAWEDAIYFVWAVRIESASRTDLDTLGLLVYDYARQLKRGLDRVALSEQTA